jgi:DNA-binding IclR family transcriptional regulator
VRREKTNYVIQSVSHALDVLEQFAGDQEELGVTELSKRLKLHKNNVFRLLATLESRGYIEQNKATENYRLGIRCLQLGQTYVAQMGFLRQARPILDSLAQATQETAFVAVFRKGGVVPLNAAEADRAVRTTCPIGETLPLHCTAAGKVHLAFIADPEVRDSLIQELAKFTERTIVDRQVFLQELKIASERGFAVEVGEHIAEVNSVAVPIRDYTHNVVGSLAVSGPAFRMESDRISNAITPALLKAGQDLSSRLGFES